MGWLRPAGESAAVGNPLPADAVRRGLLTPAAPPPGPPPATRLAELLSELEQARSEALTCSRAAVAPAQLLAEDNRPGHHCRRRAALALPPPVSI
jgi:hypothetical protein